MKVVVSGGGSAGHVSPILAVAKSIRRVDPQAQLLYLGQANSMEERIAKTEGLEFAPIKAGKFRRMHGTGIVNKLLNPATLQLNARDVGRAVAGVGGSLRILRSWRPDVVFISGGFVGLPVGIAAKLLRIPFVIHNADMSPGLANRILGKWATRIAVGFPVNVYADFDPDRLVYTGNPVREELRGAHRLEGLAKFKLNDKLPVLLVTGGSQGAQAINDAVLNALPRLLPICQIVHVTGEGDLERVKFELSRTHLQNLDRYHVYGFLTSEMALALAAADIVVGRGGAYTIAEFAMLKKPTILIPNYLMAGHQVENAKKLARQGAVRVIDERILTPRLLSQEVARIIDSEDERRSLSEGIAKFAKPDAADILANLVLQLGGLDATDPVAGDPSQK